MCTKVLGWKELGALEDPKEDRGACRRGWEGRGRARSDGAFPALLRKWEFKPPFPVKHYEASNSPLKMLSETASELP